MARRQVVEKQKRQSVPRAKTGCSTCRIRHVKCDEGRPSCIRCSKTQRVCDGYTEIPASTSRTTAVAPAASRLYITSYAIPFQFSGCQQERRIFHYFCVQGHAELSDVKSSKFWGRTVLQYSCTEPVVRQALIALSTAHLEYSTSPMVEEELLQPLETVDILREHGRAVKRLRHYLQKEQHPSKVVVLMSCLLLYAFECCRAGYDTALIHLRHGLQIIRASSQQDQDTSGSGSVYQDLARIFARLDVQAATIKSLDKSWPLVPVNVLLEEPNLNFANFDEALEALNSLQYKLLHFQERNLLHWNDHLEKLPASLVHEKQNLIEKYEHCLSLFGDLAIPMLSEEVCMLRLISALPVLFLKSTFPVLSDAYTGQCRNEVETIFNLMTSLLKQQEISRRRNIATASNSKTYTLEPGIVTSLLMLVLHSRDLGVSERATALLRQVRSRREGLMSTHTVMELANEALDEKRQFALRNPRTEASYPAIADRVLVASKENVPSFPQVARCQA